MYKVISKNLSSGPLFHGKKTKELVQHIPEYSFVLLEHEDIDEMAAVSLIQKKVKGVLNLQASMSGRYPSLGTIKLTDAHIPVYDILDSTKLMPIFEQGDTISITNQQLWVLKQGIPYYITDLSLYTRNKINEKLSIAITKLRESLQSFTINTLEYAQQELHEILKPVELPPLRLSLENRHVVVVTRGSGYIEDLRALRGYIQEKRPIFIGVDGGADAIIESGYKPDIILGDMDSVSEQALRTGAEIIVHAYTNQRAPGLERINKLGLSAQVFSCFGTSEDAAQLMAYEAGALLIVTLGSHTNMVDFLEKGRKGMGSTMLVRMKIGEKLLDAKGVRNLYPEKSRWNISRVFSIFGV